ncbi:MAG: OadG family protein [Bacteroidales bacterium]|jgi:Na+-transporting methylmalonyl-CoA/oxaloacetate decarboxylase gamma subunit|nr:OadG family protein [Bacteroidales bacterium]
MKKYNLAILVFWLLCVCIPSRAQHIHDLRLNEMLIKNEHNYIDEYGRHTPWVEIFNTSYNSVNVAECYLTNDTSGLADGSGIKRWYRIPKGDPLTLIPQRGFVIFFMDNAPLYGTFHVNFDPSLPGSSNYVALISSNGKNVIHIMHFPDSLRQCASHSYGCIDDGIDFKDDGNSNLSFLDYFTPGSTNKVAMGKTKAENLAENDKHGVGLALISMTVVFSVLIIIFLILKLFSRLSKKKKNKKTLISEETGAPMQGENSSVEDIDDDINGEVISAIAAAIHLHYTCQHDAESEIITIEQNESRYSPWAQKFLVIKKINRTRSH